MVKRFAAAAGTVMLAAVCAAGAIGLTGCAGNASVAAFEGTWTCDLEQMARDAGSTQLAPSEDMTMKLTVSQDGSATLEALGVEQEGKLTAKSADEGSLEVQGTSSEVRLEDGRLMLVRDSATIPLEKQ